MAQRINEKIQELIDAREVKTDSTGTDPVVKKHDAITRAMKEALRFEIHVKEVSVKISQRCLKGEKPVTELT